MNDEIKYGTASITGLTPGLLMHRWSEEAEDPSKIRAIQINYGTAREEAEKIAYKTPDGNLYVPSTMFTKMMILAGKRHKQKGSRQSLAYVVPAAVIIPEEVIMLLDETGLPLSKFEIDSRPVVIPATRGRIMRHRPKIEEWNATIPIEIDTSVLDVATIHQLLEEGGRRLGIGDFRPGCGGPYGRFAVTAWNFQE